MRSYNGRPASHKKATNERILCCVKNPVDRKEKNDHATNERVIKQVAAFLAACLGYEIRENADNSQTSSLEALSVYSWLFLSRIRGYLFILQQSHP